MNRFMQKRSVGLARIKMMVVVLSIAVAVIVAMGVRTYYVTSAKKAAVQVNAAQIASTLLENWKGMGGLSTYNPKTQLGTLLSSQYAISPTSSASAPAPSLSTKLTSCQIQDLTNKVYYYVTLSYAGATSTAPKALNATVSWNQKYDTDSPVADTIRLTTYTE